MGTKGETTGAEGVGQTLCGKCEKPKGQGEGFCKCGRPTFYDPKYIDEVQVYLKGNRDEYITDGFKGEDGQETKVKRFVVNLPTRHSFALHVGVTRACINVWAKKYPEFDYALKAIDSEQERRLLESGLSGEYNSTIAKLVLSHNHGYAEKTDNNNKNEIKITVEKAAAIKKAIEEM